LKPGVAGLPKQLFDECLGVVLISIVEVGFIWSGNVGAGIILKKKPDGSWSPPCACGLTGVGFGLLAGASVKDVIAFLMDEETVKSVTTDNGLKLGAQLELTLGFGRTAKGDFDFSGRGVGVPVSIAYTQGVFAGFNLEGAVVGARNNVNKTFYGKDCTPMDILVEGRCTVPEGKVTLLAEVYEKLNKCAAGAVHEPDAAALEKKAEAHAHAEKASEEVAKTDPDVVQVDATAET
jgi:lipid-binding SYLF domain-containing protein